MQEVFLKTLDNIKIAINHYSTNRNSVIIIAPGWFMTKDSKIFKKMAKALFKTFDIISMDFRGTGKSGSFYTFSAKEEQDLNCVINYAKTRYEKIFVLGFSLGGALSIISGAKNKNINGIIAVSAPTEFYKIENKMYSPDAWIPTLFQKFEPLRWLTIRAGNPFLRKEKPIDLVQKITVPTLFIAGEKIQQFVLGILKNFLKQQNAKRTSSSLKEQDTQKIYTPTTQKNLKPVAQTG